jgi:hypothetical protein
LSVEHAWYSVAHAVPMQESQVASLAPPAQSEVQLDWHATTQVHV